MTIASDPPALRVRGLSVRRGERILFAPLDFDVAAGGVLLLRGPNGAGKSSLLLTLAGIVRPETGTIAFDRTGEDGPALHLLGHRSGIKARLTAAENLEFWRAANGPTGLDAAAALEAVGIGPLATLDAGHLSAGQTRRLALARLLVTERPLWLLDEPTAALDTEGQALVGRLVEAHRARGGLAVIATHDDIPGLDPAGAQALMLGGAA
jgi:heme exporter protein A